MSIEYTTTVVIWVFTSLALLLVGTRLVWRTTCHNLGWDDGAIAVSMSIVVCCSAFLTASLNPSLSPIHASVLSLVGGTFGVLSLATPKLAVALLLIRVLGCLKKSHKWLLLGVAITVNLMGVCNAILIWFRCSPVAAVYDPASYSPAACKRTKAFTDFSLFYGSYSALCDLFYAVYPALLFYTLQMPVHRKVVLSVMMGLGLLGSVVGFYKVHFLLDLQDNNTGGLKALLWTNIEANVVHIAACVPTLPLLVTYCVDKARVGYERLRSTLSGRKSSVVSARTPLEIERSLKTIGGGVMYRKRDALDIEMEAELGKRPDSRTSRSSADERNTSVASSKP